MQILLILKNTHTSVGGTEVPVPYSNFMNALDFLQLDFVRLVPLECLFTEKYLMYARFPTFNHMHALLIQTLFPLLLLLFASGLVCLRKWQQRASMKNKSMFFMEGKGALSHMCSDANLMNQQTLNAVCLLSVHLYYTITHHQYSSF